MPSPIREELEKRIEKEQEDWHALCNDYGCTCGLPLKNVYLRAFLAGLKASLLAGPELREEPEFEFPLKGETYQRFLDRQSFNKAISAHTAKVEEIIKDLEG